MKRLVAVLVVFLFGCTSPMEPTQVISTCPHPDTVWVQTPSGPYPIIAIVECRRSTIPISTVIQPAQEG